MTERNKKIILAIVIILAYGCATYSYLNPPERLIPEEEQIQLKSILTEGCPQLLPKYKSSLNDDGRIDEDTAIAFLNDCVREVTTHGIPVSEKMKSELFYQALVREFARHYDDNVK